jgi:hypothetical protein
MLSSPPSLAHRAAVELRTREAGLDAGDIMSKSRDRHKNQHAHPVCIFCGREKLSGEHIFGDWLRKLGYDGEGVREIIPADGNTPIIQRGGPFSKKLKIVCFPCNNVWMSGMEDDAKPLLMSLFKVRSGERIGLDAREQNILARWAFKTAVVASYVDRAGTFPRAHRREFYRTDTVPRHVKIHLGSLSIPVSHSHGEMLGQTSFQPAEVTIPQTDGSTKRIPAYRAELRLLGVVFTVIGYIDDRDLINIDASEDLGRLLLPLWPSIEPIVYWPPDRDLDVIGGMPGPATVPVIGG